MATIKYNFITTILKKKKTFDNVRTFLAIEIFVMDACVLIDYLLGLSGYLLELKKKKKKNLITLI